MNASAESTPDHLAYDLTIDESVEPETRLAHLSSFIRDHKFNKPTSPLRLKPTSTTSSAAAINGSDVADWDKTDVDAYIGYDAATGDLKLLRPLNRQQVDNLTFSLVDPLTNRSLDVALHVRDTNDQPPRLVLDDAERLNGDNLVVVSVVGDVSSDRLTQTGRAISSTFAPARQPPPAVPEMGWNPPAGAPTHIAGPPQKELEANVMALRDAYTQRSLKAYRIADDDQPELNSFSAHFNPNNTSPNVIANYQVRTNGTHLLIERLDARNSTANSVNMISFSHYNSTNSV